MFLALARIAALSLSFVAAASPVALTADDAAHARDPWAKFQPGSWIVMKSTNDYFLEGKKHHDVSIQHTTMKAVTDQGVKLVTDEKGSRDGVVYETTKPFDMFAPSPEELKKATRERITIDGKEIDCAVVHFDRKWTESTPFGGVSDAIEIKAVGTAWWSDAYPVPLKLEMVGTVGGESSHRRILAEHLDVEVKVGTQTLHCVESVANELDAEGRPDPKSESREWTCAEVPGGLVRSRAVSKDEDGESTFLSELDRFFAAPTPEVTRTSETLPQPPPPTGACEVTGHFVKPDGQPADGLKASVNGRTHDVEAASKAGAEPKYVRLQGATDAEGRLELEVEALPGAEYFVEVRGPGLVKEVWRLRGLTAGGRMDLGEIKTRPCGAIVGKMETPDGHPVPGGFYVMASLKSGAEEKRGANREPMYEYGTPEAGSSQYRVDNVPPGSYEVSPYVNAVGWFEEGKRTVEVTEGHETRLDLVYTGSDLRQRVHVIVFVEPFYTLMPSREFATLKTADGRTIAAADGGMQAFNFDGVPDGACTLTIADPRFEKVVRTGMRAGTRTDIRMQAAGAVVVVARDAKTSEVIEDVSVSQELTKSLVSPRRFTVRGLGGPKSADGVLHGVVPGNSRLHIGAKGYAETSIDLKDLKPGEPRTVEVALSAAGAAKSSAVSVIAGVVRDARTTKPIAGVEVEAQCSDRDEWTTKKATSNGKGAYRFEGLKSGHWSVRATLSETVRSSSHRLELEGGERREDVDLSLPAGVDLQGVVAGLAVFAGTTPSLVFRGSDDESESEGLEGLIVSDDFGWFGAQNADLAKDGSYVVKRLAPGHYRVALNFGGSQVSLGPSSTMESPTHHALLGEVDVTEDAGQHFDFDASGFGPATIVVHVEGDAALRGSLLVVARPADPPPSKMKNGESIDAGDGEEPDANGDSEGDESDEAGDGFDTISGSSDFGSGAFNDVETDSAGALANLGRDMSARLVLPAGRWLVGVRRSDGSWNVDLPQPVVVASGATTEASLKLELVPGSVQLLDRATQAPLAGESIRWTHSTSSRSIGVTARTDRDGKLALALPRGKVRFSLAPQSTRKKEDPAAATEITWPPTADPVSLRRGSNG